MGQREQTISSIHTYLVGRIFGKVGYVYQSANFWYGGYIWTHTYLSPEGERLHPRRLQKLYSKRPTGDLIRFEGLRQIRGKQFRYIYPLTRQSRKLMTTSPVDWTISHHQKESDLKWYERSQGGYSKMTEPPEFYFPIESINQNCINMDLRKIRTL